jgi:hypothetical protein
MQHLLMLSVSAVVTIYSASAIVDSSHLKGPYGFTGTDGCIYASGGFNDRLQALGTTFSSSKANEGVETFNGNASGTFTINTTSITPPPTVGFLPAASSSQSSASITDTDDTFTVQTVPGTDVGKVLTGPRAGQAFKLEGVPMRTGLISADGRTLITSDLTPGVETLTYSNGDVEHRICWRSRVLIKLDAD